MTGNFDVIVGGGGSDRCLPLPSLWLRGAALERNSLGKQAGRAPANITATAAPGASERASEHSSVYVMRVTMATTMLLQTASL